MRRVLAFVVALLRAVPSDALTVSPLSRIRASASKLARSAEISMALPRVVVTGMGIVSCLGTTLEEIKDSLYNCKSGLTQCQEFADVGMKSQVCGQPVFDW